MADAKLVGLEALLARMKALPAAVQEAAERQIKQEAEDMVAALQRAAPVAPEFEAKPGQLRDSIHAYPTPDRPASWRIIADARAVRGDTSVMYGRYVEFGHTTQDGGHVAPKPFFWPTYRARKKAMKARMRAAVRQAIKKTMPNEAT